MASEPDKSPTTVLASVSPAEAAIEPSATRSLSFAIAVSRATGIAAARGRQSGLSLSASDSYICNAQGLVCEMVPLLAPRAIVALLLVRKNFIEITPSIQHTDDFRNVIDDAIEDDVWAGDDRSERASGDQMTGRLPSAMPFVHLPEKFVQVERLALARVERSDALVDLRPQLAQLLDMRQESPADLFLICFRQVRHFGDRSFKALDHAFNVPRCECRF